MACVFSVLTLQAQSEEYFSIPPQYNIYFDEDDDNVFYIVDTKTGIIKNVDIRKSEGKILQDKDLSKGQPSRNQRFVVINNYKTSTDHRTIVTTLDFTSNRFFSNQIIDVDNGQYWLIGNDDVILIDNKEFQSNSSENQLYLNNSPRYTALSGGFRTFLLDSKTGKLKLFYYSKNDLFNQKGDLINGNDLTNAKSSSNGRFQLIYRINTWSKENFCLVDTDTGRCWIGKLTAKSHTFDELTFALK